MLDRESDPSWRADPSGKTRPTMVGRIYRARAGIRAQPGEIDRLLASEL
jgi:hypothetical protein